MAAELDNLRGHLYGNGVNYEIVFDFTMCM